MDPIIIDGYVVFMHNRFIDVALEENGLCLNTKVALLQKDSLAEKRTVRETASAVNKALERGKLNAKRLSVKSYKDVDGTSRKALCYKTKRAVFIDTYTKKPRVHDFMAKQILNRLKVFMNQVTTNAQLNTLRETMGALYLSPSGESAFSTEMHEAIAGLFKAHAASLS